MLIIVCIAKPHLLMRTEGGAGAHGQPAHAHKAVKRFVVMYTV